ncbi:MAG: methyltransferase [Actinomycetota bacterium]|nr:methyltransferase [Actinomycetota bacterium]
MSHAPPGKLTLDPGSFRDPESRVLVGEDAIFRVLSEGGMADWRALASSPTFERFSASGALVPTELEHGGLPELDFSMLAGEVAGVLRHERIPFVSYPYEWSFAMLRDSALLQLDLLLSALDDGLILKDASPYNVQWRGTRPQFVDIGSFERLREGEPWTAYRQFCALNLNPLLLQAYRGIPFQPWLRGSLEGISPADADRCFSLRDHFRRGVLSHVHLHARLEARNAARAGADVKRELRDARFSSELIRANARKLRKLVGRLDWDPGASAWTGYREVNTYTDATAERKARFVADAAVAAAARLVWDVGANDGAYSRVAAAAGAYVVAFDYDQATIDNLYRQLASEGNERILPLVANVADPSPGLGWRGAERRPLEARGQPDLVLALALVHHLAIGANVPLAEVVAWLRSLDAAVVVEFPPRDDEMVRSLLSGKGPGASPDYELATFERLLSESFTVERREQLDPGGRVLFLVSPAD